MLELAKLEAGQMPLHLSEFQLREILDSTRPMIEPQMMEKSILYACGLDEATPEVVGDAEKVQQIFINLLANSIKFTPASGSICVSASAMDGRVAIRVTDSGPGIPPEKMESLFTPFYQLDENVENSGGTGLGLAISREPARGMGGDLEVDRSALGSGATFVLSLDAAALNQLTAEPA